MRRTALALLLTLPALSAVAAETNPPAARQPAVLFGGGFEYGCQRELASRLKREGFAVNYLGYPSLNGEALTWERIKRYNVLVISGLDNSNADGTLTGKNTNNIALLLRFVEAGGGLLYLPTFVELSVQIPPQVAFLKRVGMTAFFDEVVYDPENRVTATAWKLPFARTANFAASPVTRGITNLWYPEATYGGAQNHVTPLRGDDTWTPLVRAAASAGTRRASAGGYHVDLTRAAVGSYATAPVIMAERTLGRGRIVCLGLSPKYLFEECALLSLESVVFEKGLRNQPSQGYELVRNALRHLSEPSAGLSELGGAAMDERLLEDPFKARLLTPWDWAKAAAPPADPVAVAGVIGARTAYSTGTGTVAEWVAAARREGLGFLVFLEEFAALTPEKLQALKRDCAQATDATFTAVPGFTIDDEVGNHYFWCSVSLAWPQKNLLTADGKRFGNADGKPQGNLSGLTLGYMHAQSGMNLIGGNYLYGQDAAPSVDWFSDWCAAAVVTCIDGRPAEEIVPDYLALAHSGQSPWPFALNLVGNPARLASSPWRTVITLNDAVAAAWRDGPTPMAAYLSRWHGYPDNPCSIYISEGPRIENFSWIGPRDYEGALKGDFVWQNLRWQIHAKVAAAAGLKEVAIYDGPNLLRRFLPGGVTNYTVTLDLTHDRQHTLVVIVTDANGRRAISGNQIDRNHRLEEFMCGDRHNQLSYGMTTTRDGYKLELGGNQPLSTPNKRVDNKHIAPSGTFKNDWLIGARAFDGAASGEPLFYAPLNLRAAGGALLPSPNATEAFRLLHSGDVHVGEGRWEHVFDDNIPIRNVWGTLWSASPATNFTVRARYHFFQPDPDSPLAVFLWRFDVTLLRDLPNDGLDIGFLGPSEATMWALRGADDRVRVGRWEETPVSARRGLSLPLGVGGYLAALDSPLGGAAAIALSDGLTGATYLPAKNRLSVGLPAAQMAQRAGETRRVELLLLGQPRVTARTAGLPGASTEVVERFREEFGLTSAGTTGYGLRLDAGRVLSQRYLLRVNGAAEQGFSGSITGRLVSSLPILVSGLHDNWTAVLYDRSLKAARPVGVFEHSAWATVVVSDKTDLFIGHPVVCDNTNVVIQVTQTGEAEWTIEAHNPTATALRTAVAPNPLFDPLRGMAAETMDIQAGASLVRTWPKGAGTP